jgi:hypothetical protein
MRFESKNTKKLGKKFLKIKTPLTQSRVIKSLATASTVGERSLGIGRARNAEMLKERVFRGGLSSQANRVRRAMLGSVVRGVGGRVRALTTHVEDFCNLHSSPNILEL